MMDTTQKKPLTSYDALAIAINRNPGKYTKRLEISQSLLRQWRRPSKGDTDTGTPNPLQRVLEICLESIDQGNPAECSLAPAHFLCQNLGLGVFPLPDPDNIPDTPELLSEMAKTMDRFSDLTKEISATLEDGIVKTDESKKVNDLTWKLICQLVTFAKIVEAAVKI